MPVVSFTNRGSVWDNRHRIPDSNKLMTQLGEAVARYHRILEADAGRNAAWMGEMRETFAARGLLVNDRPVAPVLRPHFISRRQYTNLAKTAELLHSAIDRVRAMALESPALMNRMELLPAEKMLAAVDPGYSIPSVASLLGSQVNNGHMHFTGSQADLPHGVVYSELLESIFYDAAPVKELRKKYKLSKTGTSKHLVTALMRAWKQFNGKHEPTVGILDFKQQFQTMESREHMLLAEILRQHGLRVEIVPPEDLEFRGDALRRGDLVIDLVYRGVQAHEFLLRYDLTHPLVRAYRAGKVCIVNSFRTELTRKRSLFALLTDEAVTASFPAAEKKAIRETVPLTRVVSQQKTSWNGETVDLLDYLGKHRAGLLLAPVDVVSELPIIDGDLANDTAWERGLRQALRNPYVVQEKKEALKHSFPVDFYGDLVYRDLYVEVTPQAFLGRVQGCASRVTAAQSGFSSIQGYAPTFVLEGK